MWRRRWKPRSDDFGHGRVGGTCSAANGIAYSLTNACAYTCAHSITVAGTPGRRLIALRFFSWSFPTRAPHLSPNRGA